MFWDNNMVCIKQYGLHKTIVNNRYKTPCIFQNVENLQWVYIVMISWKNLKTCWMHESLQFMSTMVTGIIWMQLINVFDLGQNVDGGKNCELMKCDCTSLKRIYWFCNIVLYPSKMVSQTTSRMYWNTFSRAKYWK